MPVIKLTAGTKEVVPVDVVDRSQTEEDLSGYSPVYTVLDDADVEWYSLEATGAVGMRILPLINTSSTHVLGAWPVGHYRLFVGFTTPAEAPILGPIDIYLIDHVNTFWT
jgi:hypothetical protein